ncbi:hypothetical protein M153_3162000595, partial [Pseudoloma neurophilia]
MKTCQTCGTMFRFLDDIYVCENGHISEHQVEIVEGETSGRRASTRIKTQKEKKTATKYELLKMRFNVWKHYKQIHGLSSKIMKIYLTNIVYRSGVVNKSKELLHRDIFMTIIYMSFRLEKEKTGTYFFKDFLRDIDNIAKVAVEVRKKFGIPSPTNQEGFRIPMTPFFFEKQLAKLNMNYKQNKYFYYLLDEKFIIWIKSFLRIAQDFQGIVDFTKEITTEKRTLCFKHGHTKSKLRLVEQILDVLEKGIENTPLGFKEDEDEEESQITDVRMPNLAKCDYAIEIHAHDTKDIKLLQRTLIESLIGLLHDIGTKKPSDENKITIWLFKYIFSHYEESQRLIHYDLELCGFIYWYFASNEPRDENLLESLLDKITLYCNIIHDKLRPVLRQIHNKIQEKM